MEVTEDLPPDEWPDDCTLASMVIEKRSDIIPIEDEEGHPHQLDNDGYFVSEEPYRYTKGDQKATLVSLGGSRRPSEAALTAAFLPLFGARNRPASVNGHQRYPGPSTGVFPSVNEPSLYSDFLTPPLYDRLSQPSLQVNTDIPFGFCSTPPGSASPGLTPVASSASRPYQSSTSLLLHPEVPRGRSLWRFDDDYLTPGSNSRSLSLVSMPNLSDLDPDFLSAIRSPSVAPSIYSDSGIDPSDIMAHLDLNPSVGTSDIFGDIPEQQPSRHATDASLPPTSYRGQVASDAVAWVSQSRPNQTNAANYTCLECHQTFTAKHNLNNHLDSHYGVRNFHCEVPNCNKSFGTSHVRRRHMIKCHSESAEAKSRKSRKRLS
ncbi:hypothetical protein F5146DRAFT_416108 [Armillaria mellea]|nr:hypothetical protein F5146DRAFT_416108 [Armillaria mellea]